jgi:hypothetical protein
MKNPLLIFPAVLISFSLQAQEFKNESTIGLFVGKMNYQGDLNPNSFTFAHSKFTAFVNFRKPVNRWITLRTGAGIGKIEAADRYNRDYLKPRNLSFFSTIKEAHLGLEFTFLDISKSRFTPYMYGGIAIFNFNPWTYDNSGAKTFLKPLSTEGQGFSQFPSQKPYKLTQWALPLGGGFKYRVSENIIVGAEFSQRKTFTDYLDDVSSFYVDRDVLLQTKGAKAADLAWRADELAGNNPYPAHGEQRGTPTEMDWYYFFGLNVEFRISAVKNIFSGRSISNKMAIQRCPRFFSGY